MLRTHCLHSDHCFYYCRFRFCCCRWMCVIDPDPELLLFCSNLLLGTFSESIFICGSEIIGCNSSCASMPTFFFSCVLRRCLKIGEMFGTIVGVECESAVKKFSFQQCEQRVGTNSFAFVQATETISWMCLVRVPKKSDYNQTHIS